MDETSKLVALAIYGVCFAGFTIAVGSVLRSRGRVFLTHTFGERPAVADAVHFLLSLGFYLTCTALLLLNLGISPENGNRGVYSTFDALQTITVRLGISIFVVATFHTANVLILSVLNRTNRGSGE